MKFKHRMRLLLAGVILIITTGANFAGPFSWFREWRLERELRQMAEDVLEDQDTESPLLFLPFHDFAQTIFLADLEPGLTDFLFYLLSVPLSKPDVSQLLGMDVDDPMFFTGSLEYLDGITGGFDIFQTVSPDDDRPGIGEVDVHKGSIGPQTSNGPKGDLFVLGSDEKPFYTGKDHVNDPDEDLVYIYDFEVGHAVIRLHGQPEDYRLVEVDEPDRGLVLFYMANDTRDIVAFIESVDDGDLDLDDQHFEYAAPVDPNPSIAGVAQIGSPGTELLGLNTVDEDGNAYIVAVYSSPSGDIPEPGQMSISKYDPDGNLLWAHKYGPNDPKSYTLPFSTVFSNGHLFVAGGTDAAYGGPATGGGLSGLTAFVAKFDANGNEVLVQQMADSEFHSTAWNITADNSGHLYITGGTGEGSTTWDLIPVVVDFLQNPFQTNPFEMIAALVDVIPEDGEVIMPSVSPFVGKIRQSDLGYVWRDIDYDGAGVLPEFYSISHEALGGVVFVPEEGAAPGVGSVYTSGYSAAGGYADGEPKYWNSFLLKYDSDGNKQYIFPVGAEGQADTSWDMVSDSQGYIYMVGATHGSIGDQTHQGDGDGFVLKFDPEGNMIWARQIGGSGSDNIHYVDIFDDVLYLAGDTFSNMSGPNAGWADVFVATMDTDGNVLELNQFGTAGFDYPYGISVADGVVHVSGFTEGSLVGTSKGSVDIFYTTLDANSLEILE